jgi:cytochrome c-type biogenesis protein CcmH/NrfG
MKNYGTLIKSGAKMGEIYEDLQEYLQTHPKNSDVLRTLGDAYMKDGDLDRALEIYNEAMHTL